MAEKPRVTAEERGHILALYRRGMSYRLVALKSGRCFKTVKRIVQTAGIQRSLSKAAARGCSRLPSEHFVRMGRLSGEAKRARRESDGQDNKLRIRS